MGLGSVLYDIAQDYVVDAISLWYSLAGTKKEKCLKSIRHTVKIEKPLRNPRNRIAIYSIGLFNYTLFQVKNP